MFEDIPRQGEEMARRGNPAKSGASPAGAEPLEHGCVLVSSCPRSCSPVAAVTRSLPEQRPACHTRHFCSAYWRPCENSMALATQGLSYCKNLQKTRGLKVQIKEEAQGEEKPGGGEERSADLNDGARRWLPV